MRHFQNWSTLLVKKNFISFHFRNHNLQLIARIPIDYFPLFGHLLNPTQDHISNHQHGSKIKYHSINILWKTPLHFAACRGHLAKLEFFACRLAERPMYLMIPSTTTELPIKASFVVIKSSWNLNLELTRTICRNIFSNKGFTK